MIKAPWKMYAYLNGAWSEITDDVLGNTDAEWGIKGDSPLDLLADPGDLTFDLDNRTNKYSPNHVSALSGWKKGVPIKQVFTFDGVPYIRFRGVVVDIDIDPGNVRAQRVHITVLDWLDYAAEHPIVNPGLLTDQRGDEVLETTLGLMPIQPQATDFDQGVEVFPTTFDTTTSRTRAYDEFSKVAFSEIGHIYLRKSKETGETLVFENNSARNGVRELTEIPIAAASAARLLKEDGGFLLKEDGGKLLLDEGESLTLANDSSAIDYEIDYGQGQINRFTVYALPRRLDVTPQILFTLPEPLQFNIFSGIRIKGSYADPVSGLPINGQDIIPLDPYTDYEVEIASNGADVTMDLTVEAEFGTEGFTVYLYDEGQLGNVIITHFQVRGTGIYINNPIEHAAADQDSIDEYGTRPESMTQKYKNTLDTGATYAERVVLEERLPRTKLHKVYLVANKTNKMMQAFLNIDCGDLVRITEDQSGIDSYYYIQGMGYETLPAGIISYWWQLKETRNIALGLTPLAVEFGATTEDAVDFGYLPAIANQEEKTFVAKIYMDTNPGASDLYTIIGFGNNAGGVQLSVIDTRKIHFFEHSRTGLLELNGIWHTPTNSIPLTTWTHIAVTFRVGSVPTIYIAGVSQTLTAISPQGTDLEDETGLEFSIGNTHVHNWRFDGKIKGVQMYNRILTPAEISDLANDVEDYFVNGLVFYGPIYPTAEAADFINQTLGDTNKPLDAYSLSFGVPNGGPIGRSI